MLKAFGSADTQHSFDSQEMSLRSVLHHTKQQREKYGHDTEGCHEQSLEQPPSWTQHLPKYIFVPVSTILSQPTW